MKEVLTDLMKFWEAGTPVALATVVSTFSSAPRLPGAAMLVTPSGAAVGSVSGGCVEAAVYDIATDVLNGSAPTLERYGVSDDDAFSVGLTCGGSLDVFIQRIDQQSAAWIGDYAAAVRAGEPVALATIVEHPDPGRMGLSMLIGPDAVAVQGSLGTVGLDEVVTTDAAGLLHAGRNGILSYGADARRRGEGIRVFVSSAAPPPRLIVFGAIDFAAALAEVGSFLGFRVTVCDARPVFATAQRFPHAEDVVVQWPHRYLASEAATGGIDDRTAICVLTHDPKFDVPLLEVALRLPHLRYVGAMGSRRTHVDRLGRLVDAGLTDAELARLCSPIGLDLGGSTPQETAVSIVAEIIAQRGRGSGIPLRELRSPVHHAAAVAVEAGDASWALA